MKSKVDTGNERRREEERKKEAGESKEERERRMVGKRKKEVQGYFESSSRSLSADCPRCACSPTARFSFVCLYTE
jgi:hypothetical protein